MPRSQPSVLHADLDAFYAAVEQRDKPSLRGKPVVVGGVSGRGVVATASYEAREFGVRSAMPMVEARARCPRAAFLTPRFTAYRSTSDVVMAAMRELSPVVEPLSLDEAYVDLDAVPEGPGAGRTTAREAAVWLKAAVRERTGLTVSVGAGTSKLIAKIASDLGKPDGLLIISAGDEQALLRPLPVTRLPGVGPATATRLRGFGVHTVADLETIGEAELTGLVGNAHGTHLWRMARGLDDRPVMASRESKSVSAEDTLERDVVDAVRLRRLLAELATRVAARMHRGGLSGRTVTVKVRLHDFTTLSRSATLAAPTDDAATITRLAHQLLAEVDTTDGVRLLGVGVSGLADWTQDELFGGTTAKPATAKSVTAQPATAQPSVKPDPEPPLHTWQPGADVVHTHWGRGWVQGSGTGRVTVRFESYRTPAGPVRTFATDDAGLTPAPPLPPSPIYGEAMNTPLTVATADGPMPLFEATPDGVAAGAVIVLQEAFGVTPHIEDVCHRLAREGFLAVAPHLYHRAGSPVLDHDIEAARPLMASLTGEGLLADLNATLDHLAAAGFGPQRVGVVGFCMGGSVAILAAAQFKLGGAVTFYGGGIRTARLGLPPLLELAPRLQTPWLGLFGDLDTSIPVDDVEALRAAAAATDVPTEVVRYAGAGHAFNNDVRPDRYHEASALDAWSRTTAWLRRLG